MDNNSSSWNGTALIPPNDRLPTGAMCFILTVSYGIALFLNLILLVLLVRLKNNRRVMKLRVLMVAVEGSLLFTSVVWLLSLVGSQFIPPDAGFFSRVFEELILRESVENGHLMVSLFILGMALDRYLNLFPGYSPYADGLWLSIIIIPVLCFSFFDVRFLALFLGAADALFARLSLLLVPHLFSFVLLSIASLRPAPSLVFEPRLTSSLSNSFPRVLLFMVGVDLFSRTGLFFCLLEGRYAYIVIWGEESRDHVLRSVFSFWYQVSECLFHLFPLYFPLFLLFFVRHYRILFHRFIADIHTVVCCRKSRVQVDYRSETLASILADQRRKRQMGVE